MKLCKPYKNANQHLISQGFGENPQIYGEGGHNGLDFVPISPLIATILVAPEDVRIVKLINGEYLDPSLYPLERGYGVVMQSIAFPDMYHLYWHCSAVFPVEVGDVVKQGQAVAQMSNSGFVMSRGQIVPIDIRSIPPYLGTHLHWEYYIQTEKKVYLDPTQQIDWTIPVDGNSGLSRILENIIKLLQRSYV